MIKLHRSLQGFDCMDQNKNYPFREHGQCDTDANAGLTQSSDDPDAAGTSENHARFKPSLLS